MTPPTPPTLSQLTDPRGAPTWQQRLTICPAFLSNLPPTTVRPLKPASPVFLDYSLSPSSPPPPPKPLLGKT